MSYLVKKSQYHVSVRYTRQINDHTDLQIWPQFF